jgi:hypothetical protein
VGRAEVIGVCVEAASEEGVPLLELFDYSQDLTDHCFSVMDIHTTAWMPAVLEAWGEGITGDDLFIISNLEIDRPYRGSSLGLFSMARLIQTLGSGCGLVIIRSFPLLFDRRYKESHGSDEFTGTQEVANQKREDHYARLGFEPLPKSDLMCLAPSLLSVSPESVGCPEHAMFELPFPASASD